MGGSSAPPPQDPRATAQAQTQSNVGTAIAQAGQNNVNQITPEGNLTYTHTPSGINLEGVNVPQWTATQTLSPENQRLFDLNKATQLSIGQTGLAQSNKIGTLLGTPVDLSNSATEARLFDLGRQRLDPMFAQRREALESNLLNRGIGMGSEQYNRAMTDFGQQQNDAYNQLLLSGRGQAVQEALAQRNQPINEISALLSGSQVSQPNFIGTPQTQIANTDVAGIYRDSFNQQLANAQMANSTKNAMIGGLFGLGGAGLSALKFSDRRLKEDVKKVGKTKGGLNLFSFRYKGQPDTQIGLMAQDVEKKVPEAVAHVGGYKAVDYKMALEG